MTGEERITIEGLVEFVTASKEKPGYLSLAITENQPHRREPRSIELPVRPELSDVNARTISPTEALLYEGLFVNERIRYVAGRTTINGPQGAQPTGPITHHLEIYSGKLAGRRLEWNG